MDAPHDSREILFTQEELEAFRDTKNLLMTTHSMPAEKISMRELIIVTMNCKLRPDTAASKYKNWLDLIDTGMGVSNFDMVWEEIGKSGEGLFDHRLEGHICRVFAGEWLTWMSNTAASVFNSRDQAR